MAVDRIFITGSSGSGKSTLARKLADRTGLPMHDLDRIARDGGGRGPETTDSFRAGQVAHIVASGRWVAEGVHLADWTAPLLDAADTIVVLEHVAAPRAGGRVVRRFLSGALSEARSRHGRERFLRFSDYARKVRELLVSLPDTRGLPSGELEAALCDRSAKVVRCRTKADVDAFVESVEPVQRRAEA